MKKKVVFLLENGIGFGHFRRAITIADQFNAEKYEVIFITQAKSVQLFKNKKYKVINFPMMYRLKSNNSVRVFHTLLNELLESIHPDIVIEDTHPSSLYHSLPALLYTPRMLILRKLDESALLNYIYEGVYTQFDHVFVLAERRQFLHQLNNKLMSTVFSNCDLFSYCGDVFYEPTPKEKEVVMLKYKLGQRRTVVASFGAGGTQIGQNTIQKVLFALLDLVADRYRENDEIQFIMITGPYNRISPELIKEKTKNLNNVIITDYEEYLPALNSLADLCITRPGYNSMMEVLSGNGDVLFLPDISYMENQQETCEGLQKKYNVQFSNINDIEDIKNKVVKILSSGRTMERKKPFNNAIALSLELQRYMESELFLDKPFSLSFLFDESTDIKYESEIDFLIKKYPFIYKLIRKANSFMAQGTHINIPIINIDTQYYGTYGLVGGIYHDVDMVFERFNEFEKKCDLQKNNISITFQEVLVKEKSQVIMDIQHIIKKPDIFSGNIVLKIDGSADVSQLLSVLGSFLDSYGGRFATLEALVSKEIKAYLSRFPYFYEKLDINKIN